MSLEDIEAIKQLKARYFRYLDTKQWEKFGLVFAEDAELHNPSARDEPLRGRAQIQASMVKNLPHVVSVHHGHMPEIEILDETHARGIWAMFDELFFLATDGNGRSYYRGFGHYIEEYVKEADGQWRIRRLELRRLHLETSQVERDADPDAFPT
jgi:SnoaL-like protein